jgi:hypothetical protein
MPPRNKPAAPEAPKAPEAPTPEGTLLPSGNRRIDN